MKKEIYKFIPQGLKYEIDRTNINKNSGISKEILYSIIDVIFNSGNERTIDGGYKCPFYKFRKKIALPKHIIYHHIYFLKNKNLIFTVEKIDKNNRIKDSLYKNDYTIYYLSRDIQHSDFKLFVYKTYTEAIGTQSINEINDPYLNNGFELLKVDLENALKYISSMDKKIEDKKNWAIELHKIQKNIITMKKGKTVDRIYNNLTGLSSELHQFLYLGGEKIAEIDAKASQLTLISFLTRDVKDSLLHKLIDDPKVDIYNYILNYLQKNYEYANLLYDKRIHKVKTSEISRKDLKPHIYSAIFSGFSNRSTVSKIMNELFGDAINSITDEYGYETITEPTEKYFIDGYDFYNTITKVKCLLARSLQNTEAAVFVEAARQLNETLVPTVTKHDSIIVPASKVVAARTILESKYFITLGVWPKEHHLSVSYPNKEDFNPNMIGSSVVEVVDEDAEKNRIKKWYERENYEKRHAKEMSKNNKKTKRYRFQHKGGTEYRGNQNNFCKKYNLNNSQVTKLIQGKVKSVKGWKLK